MKVDPGFKPVHGTTVAEYMRVHLLREQLWFSNSGGLSILQEAGIYVLGHGTCPKCGAFLHLVFNKDRQEFECETWENFIEKMKGERQNGNGHERL